MNRFSFLLALLVALTNPAIAYSSPPDTSSEAVVSASEQYVATSERELEKLIGAMREFMRDQKNIPKALAIMRATSEYETVCATGYGAAKASAGDNKALSLVLDRYREYQTSLTHGGLGNADEADWDKMVAESKRLAEMVKAAARPSPPM